MICKCFTRLLDSENYCIYDNNVVKPVSRRDEDKSIRILTTFYKFKIKIHYTESCCFTIETCEGTQVRRSVNNSLF